MTTVHNRTRLSPVSHVLAWAYGALLVIPLYFMIVSAFKGNTAIFNEPFALPTDWGLHNFVDAWQNASLGSGLLNSLIVTAGAEAVSIVVAVPAAFAIARTKGSLSMLVERIFAMGLLIPAFAALVPTILLAIAVGLFQTRLFLVLFLAASAMPLSVLLLTQFMRTIPVELEESAAMDGARPLRILWSIHTPLTLPGIVTVLILNFLSFWNEYLFTLSLLGSDASIRTSQVALPGLVSENFTQYGVLLAGCLITMIPVYVVYIALQRRVENALLQGAVKS